MMNLLPFELKTAETLFLFRVVRAGVETSRLSASRVQALQGFFGEAATEFMDASVVSLPHERAREQALADVVHRLNIGLEMRSGGDVQRALAELERGDFFSAFQEGKAELAKLRERAQATKSRLHFQNALPTALSILDELNLVNTLEDIFLSELERGRLALTKPAPRLTESAPARPITCLFDLALAGQMLDNFEARHDLFRAFPPSRLFSEAVPTDEYGDAARMVISRWFVRMGVSGRETFDIRVTEDDLFLCREKMEEPETQAELRERIDRFVDAYIPRNRQRSAQGYLLSCLDTLPEILDWLP